MSFKLYLPAIYREIAERAGLDAALGLARARGGLRISVPRNPNSAPWLAKAMGEAGASALCDLYGGEMIDLPADPIEGNGQKARVRRMRKAIHDGLSANQVATMTGVTRRAVFIAKAKMRERDAEPDLFSGAAPLRETTRKR